MKKTILTGLLTAGFSMGLMAQGLIAMDNSNGTGSSTATTKGLIFLQGATTVPETAATLHAALLGGSSATSLALLNASGAAANSGSVLMDNLGPGQYTDDNGYSYIVPNVAGGGTAFFQLEVWAGNFTSMAAAQAAGQAVGMSTVFSETVGGGTATPPSLDAMPAIIMTVPEPGTFALAGLGAAAMLIFRRRK